MHIIKKCKIIHKKIEKIKGISIELSFVTVAKKIKLIKYIKIYNF